MDGHVYLARCRTTRRIWRHAHVRADSIGEHLRGEGERLSGLFSYNNSNLMNALAFSLTKGAPFTNSSYAQAYLMAAKEPLVAMIGNAGAIFGLAALASVFVVYADAVRADEPVTIAITIKDHQFDPAEVHAPAGKPISLSVKNLDAIAAEFESDALHVEKVVPPGREAVVRVRPLDPGRYTFFDDFHRATQGVLVVP